MTVDNSNRPFSIVNYTGAGTYNIPFPFFLEADVVVRHISPEGIILDITHESYLEVQAYARRGELNEEAQIVISEPNPLADSGRLEFLRESALTQESVWKNKSGLDVTIIESCFDRMILIMQELDVRVVESLKTTAWRGDWQAHVDYAITDMCRAENGSLYVAIDTFESSATFDEDLTEGRWLLILDLSAYVVVFNDILTAAEVQRDEARIFAMEAGGHKDNSKLYADESQSYRQNAEVWAYKSKEYRDASQTILDDVIANAATAQDKIDAVTLIANTIDNDVDEAAASAAQAAADRDTVEHIKALLVPMGAELESVQADIELAMADVLLARDAAESHSREAEGYKLQAATSATAASNSEAVVEADRIAAETAKNQAQTFKFAAQTSADEAQGSENAAALIQSNISADRTAIEQDIIDLNVTITDFNTWFTPMYNDVQADRAWIVAQVAVVQDYSDQAANSALAAQTQATQAANSVTTAETYKDACYGYKQDCLAYKTAAETARDEARDYQIAASTAKNEAETAEANAVIAKDSAVAAAASVPNLTNRVVQDSATGAMEIPMGTTAQRPITPQRNHLRFNTDVDDFEYWDGSSWVAGLGGGGGGGQTYTLCAENFSQWDTVAGKPIAPGTHSFMFVIKYRVDLGNITLYSYKYMFKEIPLVMCQLYEDESIELVNNRLDRSSDGFAESISVSVTIKNTALDTLSFKLSVQDYRSTSTNPELEVLAIYCVS